MSARLIDGTALSKSVRAEVAVQAAALTARGCQPGLAVVLVGSDPASQIYTRSKIKACAEAGIFSIFEEHPATLSEQDLLSRINALNADSRVHGILVQMPLPAHIDSHRVIEAISPLKDVDGFHMLSAGALMTGKTGFIPCTPYGVMKMLASTGIGLRGANAVVIGRSNTVGKPMALLLLQQSATVTVCHSATIDLAAYAKRADILIAAVGRPRMVTADMVKPGAVVIDVGVNRLPDGKLCGDVDFDAVRGVAGWISPVPGGVGPMTIAMLLMNTIESAQRACELKKEPNS